MNSKYRNDANIPEVQAKGDRIVFVVDFQHIWYFKAWNKMSESFYLW